MVNRARPKAVKSEQVRIHINKFLSVPVWALKDAAAKMGLNCKTFIVGKEEGKPKEGRKPHTTL